MTLAALIRGTPKREPAGIATANPAIPATEEGNQARLVARVATVAVAKPKVDQVDPLADAAAEARRLEVLGMLAADPSKWLAVTTDCKADPDFVLLTLAIRGKATCELRVPRDKYDPFLLLELIERYAGTAH
jgi:hypothetical protein